MNKLKYLAAIVLMSARLMAADTSFPADGTHKVDVMTISLPPEVQDIGKRLQAFMQSNREWIKTYMAEKSTPGQPLPYHEKFGITEAEYQQFLEGAKHMGFNKIADASIQITREPEKLTVKIEGISIPIDTFDFTPDESIMKCAFGTSAAATTAEQKDASSPMGTWTGKQWIITQGNPAVPGHDDAYVVRFTIGKDTKNNSLILVSIGGRKSLMPINSSYTLRWPQEPVK